MPPNSSMRASWPAVLDAIVFQRTMTPSTRRLTAEQKASAADLLSEVERRWQAFKQGQAEQHVYADKGSFTSEWAAWRTADEPTAAQLAAKAGIVRDGFERIGRRAMAPPPVHASERPWRYRRKLTLAMRRRRDGRWIASPQAPMPGRSRAMRAPGLPDP